ncbi:MAG: hypothetical protein KDB27_09565 [Planctomycetales bacterium]|nr:hypothetical protein [Planctomycetales bacterium]
MAKHSFIIVILCTLLSTTATAEMEPSPTDSLELTAPGSELRDDSVCDLPQLESESDEYVFEHIPHEQEPFACRFLEAAPTVLTWPATPLSKTFEWLLHAEHVTLKTELDEAPIGMQQVTERPELLFEWNEQFLKAGFLNQGTTLPTGAVWRPSLWIFGQYRTAYQYQDATIRNRRVSEWANRLDLFGQVNLSGTERLLVGIRPLDEEIRNRRVFSGYDFYNDRSVDGWNGDVQTLFFEGDFGEIFPCLDINDSRWLDWGFSVGRMPLLAQQGLLINEDLLDAVTLTRNTIYGDDLLNLRMTGVYAWSGINRNSPTNQPNDYDPTSRMVALLTERDFQHTTVNLDAVYVYGNDLVTGDLLTFGVSAIQRHYGYHNTYNSSLHVLGSYPTQGVTPYADQGILLFGQTSWTPHHTYDLVYVNTFWAIDQFTSPARGPLQGGPLGQTGLLFAGTQLGQFAAPLAVRTDDIAGASLGYQLFFNGTRDQVVCEVGGYRETKSRGRDAAIGTMVRYQKAIGHRMVGIVDGSVTKRESTNVTPGARAELLIKF